MIKGFLLLLFTFSTCQCLINPNKLGCERMMGDWSQYDTLMKRPMEVGDRFVVNGRVWPNADIVRINLLMINTTSEIIAIHMRADIAAGTNLIWDAFIDGRWTGREYSPQPYRPGQPYEVIMEYTGTTIQVYFNGAYLYAFRLRTPSFYHIGSTSLWGSHATNYIEMICKNPPRPTRRPGNGNGHGNGNGNGHGHGNGQGYGGGRPDSSDESCEK